MRIQPAGSRVLTAESSSNALVSKSNIPSQKQMLRTTSERFKSSSNRLEEAIQVHVEEKKVMLSMIQKLSEENQKLRAANEELEGKYSGLLLVRSKEARDRDRCSEKLKSGFERIEKLCEKVIHRQDQLQICYEAHIAFIGSKFRYFGAQVFPGKFAYGHLPSVHTEVLKEMLDDEYKPLIQLQAPCDPIAVDTQKDSRAILQECADLKVFLKSIAEEPPQT